MKRITCVTQEPHATYHLRPLVSLPYLFTHLQPGAPQQDSASSIPATADEFILQNSDLLIVTGGLTTGHTEHVMAKAKACGLPIVFIELAYPQTNPDQKSITRPDYIIATTYGGAKTYETYFGPEKKIQRIGHPTLDRLPEHTPSATPELLIGTSVSAEMRDGGNELRNLVRQIVATGTWDVKIRCHPREDKSFWKGYNLSTNPQLADDLKTAWGFLAYQTTAYLTSNAMGVPSYHIATQDWMNSLLPEGYAISHPVRDIRELLPNAPTPARMTLARRKSGLEELKLILDTI